MINKIYKSIHNKYSKFFKFLFFLRYLFTIFFVSLAFFLFIPKFFDYSKKETIIKNFILQNYDLKLSSYEKIDYNILPLPNLGIHNAKLKLTSGEVKLDTKQLFIYPNFVNIYNFRNFKAKKIYFKETNSFLETNDMKVLSEFLFRRKNKISVENFKINLLKDKKPLIILKEINYSNFGYKKNILTGKSFDRDFRVKLNQNLNRILIKSPDLGIKIELNLNPNNKENTLRGNSKIKILDTNLKFDFLYDKKFIKVDKLFLRNKIVSLEGNSFINYLPFSEVKSKIVINEINTNTLSELNLQKILKFKQFIKIINSENIILFSSKRFERKLIKELNLKLSTAYGRLSYSKKLTFTSGDIHCTGNINLIEEFPKLSFICNIVSKDKKKFLKNFSVKTKEKNENIDINIKGKFNIIKNEIKFYEIKTKNGYIASKEDLKYFESAIRKNLIKEKIFNIFDKNYIKEFILEIS